MLMVNDFHANERERGKRELKYITICSYYCFYINHQHLNYPIGYSHQYYPDKKNSLFFISRYKC